MDIQAHEQSQLSKYRALAEERMAQLTAVRRMLALQGELVKKHRQENDTLRQELTQLQESHAYLQRDYEALRHSAQWLEDATIVFVIQKFAPNVGWQDKHFCYGGQVEALAMLDKCGDGRYRLVAYVTVELARKG